MEFNQHPFDQTDSGIRLMTDRSNHIW